MQTGLHSNELLEFEDVREYNRSLLRGELFNCFLWTLMLSLSIGQVHSIGGLSSFLGQDGGVIQMQKGRPVPYEGVVSGLLFLFKLQDQIRAACCQGNESRVHLGHQPSIHSPLQKMISLLEAHI